MLPCSPKIQSLKKNLVQQKAVSDLLFHDLRVSCFYRHVINRKCGPTVPKPVHRPFLDLVAQEAGRHVHVVL